MQDVQGIFGIEDDIGDVQSRYRVETHLFDERPLAGLARHVVTVYEEAPRVAPVLVDVRLERAFHGRYEFVPCRRQAQSFQRKVMRRLTLGRVDVEQLRNLKLPLLPPIGVEDPDCRVFGLIPARRGNAFRADGEIAVGQHRYALVVRRVAVIGRPINIGKRHRITRDGRVVQVLAEEPHPRFVTPMVVGLRHI